MHITKSTLPLSSSRGGCIEGDVEVDGNCVIAFLGEYSSITVGLLSSSPDRVSSSL